ncbi:MAG: uncharacterized protein KVP18_002234 [Porospora cf. gigantea A]|uniref:uncharacterized protein n=1 Tax=Porospora cf. gigantea A TaxID=2853593 RepID=UPI003559C1ED|nr:MAG: hypothetical protein KVP18_002234 [Porospora cf. gigantea A]
MFSNFGDDSAAGELFNLEQVHHRRQRLEAAQASAGPALTQAESMALAKKKKVASRSVESLENGTFVSVAVGDSSPVEGSLLVRFSKGSIFWYVDSNLRRTVRIKDIIGLVTDSQETAQYFPTELISLFRARGAAYVEGDPHLGVCVLKVARRRLACPTCGLSGVNKEVQRSAEVWKMLFPTATERNRFADCLVAMMGPLAKVTEIRLASHMVPAK